jgi:basic membrane lipoprotein Med (substrate-binding protein (PBP1-ABC) superfamily)
MLKKTVTILIVLVLAFTLGFNLTGCNTDSRVGYEPGKPIAKEDLKIGVVYISKINDQGWSNMHYDGIKEAIDELGLDESKNVVRRSI